MLARIELVHDRVAGPNPAKTQDLQLASWCVTICAVTVSLQAVYCASIGIVT